MGWICNRRYDFCLLDFLSLDLRILLDMDIQPQSY